MDHYTSRIIVDRKLHELLAQGADARLARTARHDRTGLRARLLSLVSRWRTQHRATSPAAQDRRPVTTRPA